MQAGGGEMNFDLSDPNFMSFLIGVVGAVIGAYLIFLFTRFWKSGKNFAGFFLRKRKEKTGLDYYREDLEAKTLRISHPWMKEEQTLTDVLVPINFETGKTTEREQLEVYLTRMYAKNRSLRLLITGKPGSGKTIAMRVIARTLWAVDEGTAPVPVLMSFTDIKGIKNGEELEKKIVEKLRLHQFEQGKKNETTAETFVRQNLDTGRLFLLFDGYDELEKSARQAAARMLNTFLDTHRKIPAVFSSRTALYDSELAFADLKPQRIRMSPFTPFAILRFLSQWQFEGKKSSLELFEMINGRAHLSELASNPLMLTIITFLYSKPKYTLPDNRVQFYEQCSLALLEEWDRTKQVDRANKFESDQKVAVLSRVAFEHISSAGIDDELIDREVIHKYVREVMERMSLKVDEYPLMTDEIVRNSGLIHAIPPNDYRFPHRTFMEYFAAHYLEKKKSYEEMLDLYNQDPGKWKEVLLLYLGLNKNKDYADAILERLIAGFKKDMAGGTTSNLILFPALTQCAVPDPGLADTILNLAEASLKKKPGTGIIEELGYIAANPRWAYAKRAREILIELSSKILPDDAFQQVISSLVHAGGEDIDQLVLQNLERVNLVEFLSKLGAKGKVFIDKLFRLKLSKKYRKKIIDGLKEAGSLEILGHLLIENRDEEIKTLAAYALFRMSKLDSFYEFVDNTETGLLAESTKKMIDRKYDEWGWRWERPHTESGKKLAILICLYSADWLEKSKDESDLKQVDNRFRYLTTGFLVEKGILFVEFNLIGFKEEETATKYGLKKWWQKDKNLKNAWNRFFGWADGVFLVWAGLILYSLISLLGIVGFIQYQFGFTSNGFYKFLFDPFTVNVLFFQFVLFYILTFVLLIIYGGFKGERFWQSLLGPAIPYFFIIKIIKVIGTRFLIFIIFSYLLAIGILFVPFHNIIFNAGFFLCFSVWGHFGFEYCHIDFALFDIAEVEKVQDFLYYKNKEKEEK
jgi:DNA polymerase III delta prime subunit